MDNVTEPKSTSPSRTVIKPWSLGTYNKETFNEYYPRVISDLKAYGDETRPRGLLTKELHPTFAQIANSRSRIVTPIGRVLNLPFALAEVVQILGGLNDAQALKYYNSKITDFQGDDGPNSKTFNAAYGHRLRHYDVSDHRQIDQLKHIIETLKKDPDSRQATCVISHPLWDNYLIQTKDRACNLVGHAMIRDGKLDWMQVIRSNDAIFGLPYNIFQWAHVQEYVATALHVGLGKFTIVQDSLHVYEHQFPDLEGIEELDIYKYMGGEVYNMVSHIKDVVHWEQRVREDGPIALPRDNDNDYWREVIECFNAYACFKNRQDTDVFKWLPFNYELRWPLLRWMCSVRWNNQANHPEYKQYKLAVIDDLAKADFPSDKILPWLGFAV